MKHKSGDCKVGRTVYFQMDRNANYALICLFGFSVMFPELLVAQDSMPAISNDPTKTQQAIPDLLPLPEKKGKGFELPALPKHVDQEKGAKTIQLKQVVFTGNTVFTNEELQDLLVSYLNRPLSAVDLESMRSKATQYYIDHGYINSGALLTTQSVAEGVLSLTVVEGKLTEVRQSGQERLREGYIRDRLLEGSGDPLNVQNLQNSYRQLLSDPLIQQLNGSLLPGVHPGEAVLDVKVTRNRPYQAYAGADDYSTPAVGSYAGRMGGWVDNLMTLGERIDGQFIVNGTALGYNMGITMPITAQDTRVSFRYSDTHSSLTERASNPLNLQSQITGFDGGILHPIYRTLNDNLKLGLNFAVRQSQTLLAGRCDSGALFTGVDGDHSCNTQVTVLRVSQRYTHRVESTGFAFYSTFNVGINALGATTYQPLGGQGGEFFSWLAQSMFNQRILDNGTQLVLRGAVQIANSPLLPLERFSVGGVNTARGYQENSYIRDNGFNTTAEIKYPLYGGTSSDKNNLFLVPFIDYAGGWNVAYAGNSPPVDYLFSSGLGFNWQYKQVSTDFYWGHAFNSVVPKPSTKSIQDEGIHFRVNVNAF
ncbi:POTRA domain-containing protein [Methylomonas sp. AM2-LC]|uniref:ShlB/FhaC/HecB family hemolysin secretion/activation protein n=1 Tax=Methylomonas sp. AM2-LC TaxID=3153301 RepID=UPI0032642842